MRISATKLSDFLACPRKYKFRYIDKIKPRITSFNLIFGRAMHRAIYECIRNLKCNFSNLLLEDMEDIAIDADLTKVQRHVSLGEEFVDQFLERDPLGILRDEDARSKAARNIEQEITLPVVLPFEAGEPDHLTARIDLMFAPAGADLLEDSSRITLVDIKTKSQKETPGDLRRDVQLTFYALVYNILKFQEYKSKETNIAQFLKSSEDALNSVAHLNFVKTKKPDIQILTSPRNQRDFMSIIIILNHLKEFTKRSLEVGRSSSKITNSDIFYPTLGFNCRFCDYKVICYDYNKDEAERLFGITEV